MKLCARTLLFASTLSSAAAYSIKPQNEVGRREMFQKVGAAAFLVAASPANALDGCPKGSNNCLTTKWTPPAGTIAVKFISDVIILQKTLSITFFLVGGTCSLFLRLTICILNFLVCFECPRHRLKRSCEHFEKGN